MKLRLDADFDLFDITVLSVCIVAAVFMRLIGLRQEAENLRVVCHQRVVAPPRMRQVHQRGKGPLAFGLN